MTGCGADGTTHDGLTIAARLFERLVDVEGERDRARDLAANLEQELALVKGTLERRTKALDRLVNADDIDSARR